jgi:hypothetical protein
VTPSILVTLHRKNKQEYEAQGQCEGPNDQCNELRYCFYTAIRSGRINQTTDSTQERAEGTKKILIRTIVAPGIGPVCVRTKLNVVAFKEVAVRQPADADASQPAKQVRDAARVDDSRNVADG